MLKIIKEWIASLKKKNNLNYISEQFNAMGSIEPMINENSFVSYDSDYIGVKEKEPKTDTRIEKKPIEIFEELYSEIPSFNYDEKILKDQIKLVGERIRVLSKHTRGNLNDERKTIQYLKARLLFKKYGHLFIWKTTNETMIQKLVSTYKVQKVNFESYIKVVPNDALNDMEKFAEAYYNVVDIKNAKPIFELIVDYQGKEHRRDPILLAQSPFGRWYYVLGAWDKEVEIVEEIIYKRQ